LLPTFFKLALRANFDHVFTGQAGESDQLTAGAERLPQRSAHGAMIERQPHGVLLWGDPK
jgi:hypothetical protein